ncbi:MAG TPA: tetratricopeptide repeat protein [Candidatus Brocadiia bacterium]|nr:tetratricopeptide repeat protein [Candidatus Brocadiales bacterium]
MPNKREEISKKYTETPELKATLKSEIAVEGELPCILVYSENKHVDYIYPLLLQIETVLKNHGFKPQRLGDEIRSTEDYLNKLEELIKNCVSGVVVLDGFRPNVLFEFGFLKGSKKPIVLLQSKDAVINVKTLYESFEESDLGDKSFKRLRNPSIIPAVHLSDWAGKHIAFIDWKAKETEPKHPSVVLKEELKKNEDIIIKEAKNLKAKNITSEGFLQPLTNIIKYYIDAVQFSVDDLKKARNDIISIAREGGFQVPEDVYSMIATTYYKKGEYDLAISDYNKAIEINPRLAEAYYNRGTAYGKKGEYDRAILDFNKAIEINPRLAEAYYNRGTAYGKKGEYDRAILDYNKALEINPRLAEAYNNRGTAYSDKGEYDLAILDFNKALEINPRDAKAYINRGNAYNNKGEYDMAILDFNKALEINPRLAEAYNNRGNTYDKKGEYDSAISDYNRALEINPRYADAYYNRGTAYGGKGEYDRAIEDFNKALEINPRNAKAYINRAVAYCAKGDYDRAWEDVHKAQDLGYQVNPKLLELLREASGRQR